MEGVEIGTIGAGPGGLRRTERGKGAARELRLGAGVATGEREGTRDEEWLGRSSGQQSTGRCPEAEAGRQ
jgi:hypothetical protein